MIRIKEYSSEYNFILMCCDLCGLDWIHDPKDSKVICLGCKNEDELLWIKKKSGKEWAF